mgnify:CR=1 FL=1
MASAPAASTQASANTPAMCQDMPALSTDCGPDLQPPGAFRRRTVSRADQRAEQQVGDLRGILDKVEKQELGREERDGLEERLGAPVPVGTCTLPRHAQPRNRLRHGRSDSALVDVAVLLRRSTHVAQRPQHVGEG